MLWVRLAGLPARVLAGLGDPALPALLDEIESLRATGAGLRRQAADLLHAQIPRAEVAERRVLLALRRDAHQGRPLTGYRQEPCWPAADGHLGGLLGRIADLDDRIAAREAAFEAAHASLEEGERRALFAAAEPAWFRRGLALAAPAVVEALDRHRARPFTGKKARRLEASLLRYLSRAALKLSPYSTLTPLALAEARPLEGEDAVAYSPGPRSDRSLVRIKRYLLDQCWRLLVRYPPLRPHLRIGLNPSSESLGGGHYRFLRLSSLTRSGAEERIEKAPPAHVTVRLGGEMVPCFCRLLARTDLSLPHLLGAVEDELGAAPEEVARAVEQLVEIGFLERKPPWPGYEPWLEKRLLDLLETVADPALEPVTETLGEIVALEEAFSSAADPARAVRRLDDRAVGLYAAIGAAVDPAGTPPLTHIESRSYYEDVLVAPRAEAAPCLLKLDRGPLARALAAGDLIWRVGAAFEPRHELLIALERHWTSRHAGESHLPLMQLWAESRPLWTAYRRHREQGAPGAFDPFSAPEIRELERLRASLRRRLGEVIEFDGLVETVPTEAYRAIAQEVPAALGSPIDPCLFLQPCDPRGERWVVNLCCEGSGRMTCRFNVLLDADERRLLERREPHPGIPRDGEEVEIVDLLFTRGNTVNLHWPSRRVVLSPGESADLPPERVLRLADLQVRRRAGQPLSLHDPEGRRIVPCFLSPLAPRFLPVFLRFLGIFGGQSEVDLPVPPLSPRVERGEGWSVRPRQVIENLVVRRRRWEVGRDLLPS
ncbi:MAG TPA: lantibiotic dehydratase, partial [Thermoanaerobaculia bacterium]|nr:lantibiotic dehydratase [Thermoanaerobaculia bacterium]